MRQTLLALFRGRDGQSLARALAALVLVNAVLAGLHGGVSALTAAQGAEIHCAVPNDGGHPATPAREPSPCCLVGCATAAAPMLPAAGAVLRDVRVFRSPGPWPFQSADSSSQSFDGPGSQRGPPRLV